MTRNSLVHMTKEEWKIYRNAQRKAWYEKNKEHYQQRAKERDAERIKNDPNYVSNKEFNREYYRTKIKPMRELVKKLSESGIVVGS
jgi:hypothetical protein